MIPSVTQPAALPKPAPQAAPPTAAKTAVPPAPETGRGSVGETAAGNIRAETRRAIDAPEQAAVLPRLRDQERAVDTERRIPEKDTPTGPQPTFEETPLERQARVALEPPDPVPGEDQALSEETGTPRPDIPRDASDAPGDDVPAAPPPTPRERAEVSFAETRSLAASRDGAALDIAR
jgi:hypothetical protein